MSLLLDALKKAAEQKAQKSKQETPRQGASEETLLDPAAADVAGADDGDVAADSDDETELEHTEIRARLERGGRIAGDETGLDFTDHTDSGRARDDTGAGVSEETGLEFPGATDAGDDREYQPARAAVDETGLDIPAPLQAEADNLAEMQQQRDDTGLDIPEPEQTAREQKARDRPSGDDTGLDVTGAQPSRPGAQSQVDEDETIVSASVDVPGFSADQELDARRPVARDDDTDTSRFGGPATSADEDMTDISEPVYSADQVEASRPELPPGIELSEIDDHPATRADAAGDEDLSLLLVDTTDNRASGEPTDTQSPTLTNPTATQLAMDETRSETLATPTRSTVTRPADSTSTRTYAPDNYDRTLMKLPSDDASRLFAGMKSEGDVVMTPDYAKKVFRSKTSAQRVQHYKFYAGIAIALLLAIAIYGGMEYQDESEQIDASLRPLKRDPMPGIIKPQQERQASGLFSGTDGQVDARTIEIVRAATQEPSPEATDSAEPDSIAAEAAPAEPAGGSMPNEVAVVTETISTAAEPAAAPSPPQPQPQPQPQPRAIPAGDDTGTGTQTASAAPATAGSTLQIKTTSQYREIDILLREAYEAYRSGKTALALARYNQVLDAEPGNRNALLARAAINIEDGNIDAAIRDYQVLLLANPKDSLAMSSLLGVASYSPQETETQLKLMIRDEPESPYLNFALANAYGAQNRWREAQAYYFRALQNNPEDPNYAYNLAVSLEHISQPVSAITYYQRALENFDKGLATFSREVVGQRLEVLGKL